MHIRSSIIAAAMAGTAMTMSASYAVEPFQQYFAVLDAANESDSGKIGAVGTAMVMFGPAVGQVCFAILVRGVDTPTAAHIHNGAASVGSGPVVVTLVKPAAGNPGHSSGCIGGVAPATLNAIKANPTKFYINVHSTAKLGGALRGQLF